MYIASALHAKKIQINRFFPNAHLLQVLDMLYMRSILDVDEAESNQIRSSAFSLQVVKISAIFILDQPTMRKIQKDDIF